MSEIVKTYHHEAPLEREVLVGLTPSRLKSSDGKKERGTIPTHILQRMDGHIERYEKDAHNDGEKNRDEFGLAGIHAALDWFQRCSDFVRWRMLLVYAVLAAVDGVGRGPIHGGGRCGGGFIEARLLLFEFVS
jgi:hypothetical protein